MPGGSTRKGYATSVRRQSRQRLCSEFRLRQGFAAGKTLVRAARRGLAREEGEENYAERTFEKCRHHRPRRPRQNHAGGRDAEAGRRLPGESGGGGPGHGLRRPGAGAGYHHPGQEHRHPVQGHQDQHRGYPGPRRLRRRGGAHPEDGQRRHPAGGRRRGPHAPDPLRALQGPGAGPPGHCGGQQDRPARPADPRGGG